MFPNVGKRASNTTVEGITSPITSMATQLRDLQQSKAAESSRLRDEADELYKKAVQADADADHAARIADQLAGLVL